VWSYQTCQNRPLHPSFLEIIREQVKNGDVEGGVAKIYTALQVAGDSDVVLQTEARRLAAPGLVDKGRQLAQKGDIDGAIGVFKQAFNLDSGKDTHRMAVAVLIKEGLNLAKQGAIREAIAAFTAAQATDPNMAIAAYDWNDLCWNGSLAGFASDVMAACERAVALESDNGAIHDSRGVARVLTGDYPGAIKDFQYYLEWGPKHGHTEEEIRQRQDWIRMLQVHQNPFNEELLRRLRDQQGIGESKLASYLFTASMAMSGNGHSHPSLLIGERRCCWRKVGEPCDKDIHAPPTI
jgi:tetratricopeptide (TPR) repeat protein